MENRKLIPTDREGLYLDPQSGAILNVDNVKLEAYKKRKASVNEISNNSQRIDRLENEIGDIKSMLRELLDRGK